MQLASDIFFHGKNLIGNLSFRSCMVLGGVKELDLVMEKYGKVMVIFAQVYS